VLVVLVVAINLQHGALPVACDHDGPTAMRPLLNKSRDVTVRTTGGWKNVLCEGSRTDVRESIIKQSIHHSPRKQHGRSETCRPSLSTSRTSPRDPRRIGDGCQNQQRPWKNAQPLCTRCCSCKLQDVVSVPNSPINVRVSPSNP
jgi:hypothetical protein